MVEKRLKLIAIIALSILILSIFAWINSPISQKISRGETFKILIYSQTPYIITYDAKSGKAIIKVTKTKKRSEKVSINQTISEIFSEVEGNFQMEIPYIDISEMETEFYKFADYLSHWRKKTLILPLLIKKIFDLKTNIGFFDKISLMIETLHIKPAQIIFLKTDLEISSFEKPVSRDEIISVEIINSGAGKKIEEVIKILKNNKIDVLDRKNSQKDSNTAIIINNIENFEKARKVMNILKLGDIEIYLEKTFMISDVRIILGKDFKGE